MYGRKNRYLNSSSLWISLFRVWRSLHSFPIFSARITRITFPPLSPPNFVSEGPPPMKGAQYSSTAGMKGCRASHFFIASPLSFNPKMYSMKNLILRCPVSRGVGVHDIHLSFEDFHFLHGREKFIDRGCVVLAVIGLNHLQIDFVQSCVKTFLLSFENHSKCSTAQPGRNVFTQPCKHVKKFENYATR